MKEFIEKDLISIIEVFGFVPAIHTFKKLFADLYAEHKERNRFKIHETFAIAPTWYLKLYYGSIFVCFFEADIQVIIFDSQFLGEQFFWKHPYIFESKKEVIKNLCFGIEKYRLQSDMYNVALSSEFIAVLNQKIIPLLKSKERANFKKVLAKYKVDNIDDIRLNNYYKIVYSYLKKDWDIPLLNTLQDDNEYLKILLESR